MSLFGRTITALKWTTGARIAQQVFQFALSVVLMRMLGPKAFGLIGMVLVFSGFAEILSELGFGSALVQRQELREEHRSTIFSLTIVTGGLLALILFFGSPLIAAFYKEPLLKPMTRWIAVSFVLGAFGIVPRALLQKALRFDVLAKVDIAALLLSGAMAVGVAAFGGGVWSLVAQQVLNAVIASVLLLCLGGWRPCLLWSRGALRELFGYGAGLTGFNVINYWARSADKMLIGRLIGPTALGLYSRAYSLMLLPLSQIVSVLGPVMFPTMSSIQDDKMRARRIFLRVMDVLTFLTFPMMLGLVVVAKPFVLGLFGAEWTGVIPLIQILAIVGMTQTLCNPTGWIYTSQGRTDWMFWWGFGGSGFLILSIVIGIVLGGIETVALAYLVGNLIVTVPCLAIPGRLIGMSVGDVWQAIRGNFLCAAGMAAVVWGIGRVLPVGMAPMAQLAVEVPTGVLVYCTLSYLSHQSALQELSEVRLHLLARRPT